MRVGIFPWLSIKMKIHRAHERMSSSGACASSRLASRRNIMLEAFHPTGANGIVKICVNEAFS
jgi:hypothetical protein